MGTGSHADSDLHPGLLCNDSRDLSDNACPALATPAPQGPAVPGKGDGVSATAWSCGLSALILTFLQDLSDKRKAFFAVKVFLAAIAAVMWDFEGKNGEPAFPGVPFY